MELSRVKEGDIVQVDRLGRRFYAKVTRKTPGELIINPITPNITFTSAKARHIIGIYGKRKGSA